MLALDRAVGTPLYLQVANKLRRAIDAGELDAAGALPSERALTELTGTSRVTVRKAIERLVNEGLILRRQGSGTYLAARIEQPGGDLSSFTADARLRGAAPRSIWLVRGLATPTGEEAGILQIATTTPVARLGRVRLANNEPLAIEHAVVPAAFLPPLDRIGISLYAALASVGQRPVRGEQRIRASLTTAVEAALLSVDAGSAVLRIERRSFAADGTPVELTHSAYRGDRYDFVTALRQDDDH